MHLVAMSSLDYPVLSRATNGTWQDLSSLVNPIKTDVWSTKNSLGRGGGVPGPDPPSISLF